MKQTTETLNKGISILMLGGAGAMGRVAIATTETFAGVSAITIADRNGARAAQVAAQMGDKVTALGPVDAMDFTALVAIMRDHDYVISTLGPYYKFGTHVLKAAIEAGTDYIDICDDWEPTLDMLALDEAAKAAGISALVGGGSSPGTANMLALKAMRELDTVTTLYTGWGAQSRADENDSPDPGNEGAAAAVEHWVHQFTGSIRVRENGKFIDQAPLEQHILQHPEGGKCSVYTLGHPEAVTFPRYFSGIQNSYNVMDMSDFVISLLKSIGARVDRGLIDIPQAAVYLEGVSAENGGDMRLDDFGRYILHTGREILRGKKYMPDMYATAIGIKDGKQRAVCVRMNGRIAGGMGPMTCVPTSVFLAMFINGSITRKGVFAPEAGVDPDAYFELLAPYITRDNPALPHILTTVL